MRNERNQLHTLVGNKRKSTEDSIAGTIKDAPENKKKKSRKLHMTAVTTIATMKKVSVRIINSCVLRLQGGWLNRWDDSCQRNHYKPNSHKKKGITIVGSTVFPTRTLVGKENGKQLLATVDFQKFEIKICK
jgi:hypothetical protein